MLTICTVGVRRAQPARRGWAPFAFLGLCLLLPACAGETITDDRSAAARAFTRDDLRWLNRVTFGIDTATVARYRQLGRLEFLDEQLRPPADDPPELAATIAAIPVTQQSAEQRLRTARAEQQRLNPVTLGRFIAR